MYTKLMRSTLLEALHFTRILLRPTITQPFFSSYKNATPQRFHTIRKYGTPTNQQYYQSLLTHRY